MTTSMPLTSIIIPTYNHAEFVSEAIRSALAQTVPVEVLVIDDGSTDHTAAVLHTFATDARVRMFSAPHQGPSGARNVGLDAASGEYVMFLDADDTIAADKCARQIAALRPEQGWIVCDVRIEDVSGRQQLASQRYAYARKAWGWLQPQLAAGNFIPIHAPLMRRSEIEAHRLRFRADRFPEDWHFFYALAGVARCGYLPDVLATYQKRLGGRNTGRWRGLQCWPGAEAPIRLNLGCGTPGKPSWHPIQGLVNLDKSLGWTFEDGLRSFADGSVAGITISHALMFVPQADWPRVFAEFARVLRPGGVIRVTEDDATDPASSRYGGWKGSESAVTLTDAALVRRHLQAVGLTVFEVTAHTTQYPDRSLCQAQHGDPPHVFFLEGVKQAEVLFAPHADDETLFAAFTLIRHRPQVVICCPSARDYGDTAMRLEESRAAVAILGAGPVVQWQTRTRATIVAAMRTLDTEMRPARVWAPAMDASHPEHVLVAQAAAEVFGDRVTAYQTYTETGKVRAGTLVPFEPAWTDLKRQALACYASQQTHPRAQQFFTWDFAEYLS